MDRANYIDLFSIPDDYKPPEDSDLRSDTKYPNLNSKDYRKKPADCTPKMQPFCECIAINENGNVILASNDIRGRIWNGYLWGFEDIRNFGDHNKACFKLHCDSPVTNLRYVKNKIFLLSEANGALQLWSTKSELRSTDYCLFKIGEKTEHLGVILSLDILQTDFNKAVTGSSDSSLKVWDMGSGDLFSIHTMRFAHSDSITGISCGPGLESTFATCSTDKSALLWDYRQPRPATALYDNHKYAFTAVYWSRSEEKDQNIILGDETGNIYSVDARVPNKFIDNVTVFTRPVRKIRFQLNQMAVIGNTNMLKVFKCSKTTGYELLYKDSQATNFIRDVLWNSCSENELYTVGWDANLRKHVVE